MDYSENTALLLKRMEKVALRQEYVFDKKQIKKLFKEVYSFLDLPLKEINFCKDITDEKFLSSASRAYRASSAYRASRVSRAYRASRASSAYRVSSAYRASRVSRASSAYSASRAYRAYSASSASIDIDFDWGIYNFEYYQKNKLDKDGEKYLKVMELFLQLKEAGVGYFSEYEGILYCCPNPIVQLDSQNRYHAIDKPALNWGKNLQLYYLSGANFEKDLWEKIVTHKISAKEVLSLSNMEQRMAALREIGVEKILDNANLIDSIKGYELYEIKNVFIQTAYYLKYRDTSTDRLYVSGIDPEVGKLKDAIRALCWKFSIDYDSLDNKRDIPFDLQA